MVETSKKHIFMIGRQHSSESMNSPIMEYMMSYIEDNQYLLDNFHWYFIPEINPDECAGDSSGYSWQIWNSSANPIIVAVRNKCQQIDTSYTLDTFFDWHSLGSGYGSHILHYTGDTAGAALCSLMVSHTTNSANTYTCEPETDPMAYAYAYAYLTWECPSFTPEPTQCDWRTTSASLQFEGEGFADAIYDYFY